MCAARSEPSPPTASPFSPAPDGVRVRIRVTPRARRAGVLGVRAGADGRPLLAVAVTEAPEGGCANEAVVALLARAWRLPKSTLAMTSGASGRSKTIHIAGEGAGLMASLQAWYRALAPAQDT